MTGSTRSGPDRPADPEQPNPHDRRPPDHPGTARDDLSQRLDRMAPGHPSSASYATEDRRSRRADDASARRPESPGDRSSEAGRAAPGARGIADRPAANDIRMTSDRATHMLDGDGPGKPGGGHRHGTGRPRKSEFPENWADDKVVSAVQDVARHPDEAHWQESNARWRVTGEREGVRVTAVVLPDGRIWTAWPEPGRAGTTQEKAG